ncbi:MAG TPA: hypothetical protein VF621_16875 [Pyrinomonadaceae bacterium]
MPTVRGDALTESPRRANPRAGRPKRRASPTVIGAGFRQFRRAAQTPFNRVFEARR